MDFIEIEIVNWEKYNPRADRKVHSWFRFQNDFFSDQKLWHLDDTKRCHLLFLFCEFSKNFGKRLNLDISFVAHQRKTSAAKITEVIRELADLGVIKLPNGADVTPKGNATNERTNERTYSNGATPSEFTAAFFLGAVLNQEEIKALYPEEYIKREALKAAVWCKNNKRKAPKKNFAVFFTSWLSRGWDSYRKTIPSQKTTPWEDTI